MNTLQKRKCFICDIEYTCKHTSKRKNCDLHSGLQVKNTRIFNGQLQRKCAKCRSWSDFDKFHSKQNAKKSSWCSSCTSKNSLSYQNKRSTDRKAYLINLKGGKCELCNYNKNTAALVFHHLDINSKDIGLDRRTLSGRSLELLVDEVSKCQLLCHNCHMEVHYPQYNIVL